VKKLYTDNEELEVPARTLTRWKQKEKLMALSHRSEQSHKSWSENEFDIPLKGNLN
jgi:hypothetical protein